MCWLIGLVATYSGMFIAVGFRVVFLCSTNVRHVIDTNRHTLSIIKSRKIRSRLEMERKMIEKSVLIQARRVIQIGAIGAVFAPVL